MTETLKSNLLATERKKEKGKREKKSQVQLTASREDRIELSSPETWETVPLIAPADLIVSRTGLNLTLFRQCRVSFSTGCLGRSGRVVSARESIISGRADGDLDKQNYGISGRQSRFLVAETLQPIKTQYNRSATIQTTKQSKCNCARSL